VREFSGCLVVTILLSFPTLAQEKLVMYPSFGGAHFEYEKDTAVYQVTPRQVSQILFEYADAYKEFKKARKHSTWSGIIGFVGAGLVVLPIASAAVGGDPEWGFAAGGAALIAGSFVLGKSYRKTSQHAIDMFNQRKGSASLQSKTQLYFAGTGVKLVIRF